MPTALAQNAGRVPGQIEDRGWLSGAKAAVNNQIHSVSNQVKNFRRPVQGHFVPRHNQRRTQHGRSQFFQKSLTNTVIRNANTH